jgi:glycosyltransferase involved in cell wall biosynthesis
MISIIIPNFNKATFITQTLESLLQQTFQDWQAIIVDDLSTDDSMQVINSYTEKDTRFKFIQNKTNSGGSFSRNKGLALAKGKYVIFLDSDDILSPDCLENRFKEISHTLLDFLVFPMGTFYQKIGDSKKTWIPKPSHDHLKQFLSHDLPWQTMQAIWQKDFLSCLKGFDKDYPRLQDVELHTRALLHKEVKYSISLCSEPDCFYRIDNARLTCNQENFMFKGLTGACLYINKTSQILQTHNDVKRLMRYLRGTYFSFLNQVLYRASVKMINKKTRDDLIKQLESSCLKSLDLSFTVRLLFSLYILVYKIGLYKIKGFNYLAKKVVQL